MKNIWLTYLCASIRIEMPGSLCLSLYRNEEIVISSSVISIIIVGLDMGRYRYLLALPSLPIYIDRLINILYTMVKSSFLCRRDPNRYLIL